MERLWAPWRIEYIQKIKEDICFLCQKAVESDDVTNLVLYRGKENFVIMNAFPYNPGHLMVVPYRHTANLPGLTDDEAREHFELIGRSLKLLTEVLNPEGFNVGMNIGRVAGAGVEGHLHTHIVPRWQGDTNFMPVLSDTRVVSEALANTYKKLKANLS